MSSHPSVSIITPCFNGETFLRETIESVLNQSTPVAEMIVIDDGSNDRSAEIAASYPNPVKVIRQANAGESVARNRGIDEAIGSHMLFLDADDLLHRDGVSQLIKLIDDPLIDVPVMSCGSFTETPDKPFSIQTPAASTFFPTIFEKNIAPIHCWLVPTPLVRKVGGFLGSLQYFEDWDFWGQLGLHGAKLKTTDFVGCYYRRFDQSQTKQANQLDRKLGQAVLVERLISKMIDKRPDLLPNSAEPAFWAAWNCIEKSLEFGASWNQVKSLAKTLEKLTRLSRPHMSSVNRARFVDWIGVRHSYRLNRLIAR